MGSVSAVSRSWVMYVRVSRVGDRSGDAFRSPQQQQDEMLRWISRRAGDLAGPVFEDLDVSGGTFQRPGFEKAWAWVMDAPTERGFLVYDLSRFGREKVEFLVRRKELYDAGSELAAATEDVSDELSTDLKALVADWYRQQSSARWKRTIQDRFEEGHHHGAVPTGYVLRERKLSEDEVLGPVVREIFRLYPDDKTTTGQLVSLLARARGRDSSLTALRRLVENRTYLGEVTLKGLRRVGVHPALVDEETFERCQARRRRDGVLPSRVKEKKALLSGLIYCADCGGRVIRTSGSRAPVLVCTQHQDTYRELRGRRCERGIGAPQERLVVEVVLKHLRLWQAEDSTGAAQAAELQQAVALNMRLKEQAEHRLQRTQHGISALIADQYSGDLDLDEFNRALSELRTREIRAQADLDTSREGLRAAERAAGQYLNGDQRRMLQKVVEAWPHADAAHRRRILDTWVGRIEIARRPSLRTPLFDVVRVWQPGWYETLRPAGITPTYAESPVPWTVKIENYGWPIGQKRD